MPLLLTHVGEEDFVSSQSASKNKEKPQHILDMATGLVSHDDEDLIAEDTRRMRSRIEDAVNDAAGRIRLFLNDMRFREIDLEVTRIRSLEQLYAQNNPVLRSLPPVLSPYLPNLRTIDISHCAIESLPEDLGELSHLEVLNVSHNQLTRLVWDVTRWTSSMRSLDISNNRIRFLSPSCVQLFRSLLCRYETNARVQLHAEPTLMIWPATELITPLQGSSASATEQQRQLTDMLPDHVEHCSNCGSQVAVGKPRVYVRFWTMNPGRDVERVGGDAATDVNERATSATRTTSTSSTPETVPLITGASRQCDRVPQKRIPVVYPLCLSDACHLETHRKILLEGLTGT